MAAAKQQSREKDHVRESRSPLAAIDEIWHAAEGSRLRDASRGSWRDLRADPLRQSIEVGP
jgi:hypothetical protein